MKAWLERLTAREQMALAIAALSVLGLLLYLFFWQPLDDEQHRLRTRLNEQFEALARMQQIAQEALQLRSNGRSVPQQRTEESLLALVDRTARAAVADGLNRLEPDGEHAVKLWLKDVSFDSLVRWLQELETAWGVRAKVVSLQRTEQPGLVTGRLVLEELAE